MSLPRSTVLAYLIRIGLHRQGDGQKGHQYQLFHQHVWFFSFNLTCATESAEYMMPGSNAEVNFGFNKAQDSTQRTIGG